MTAKVETISADNPLECSVCLQTCIHPVQLPCRHIFCFLCVKGAANRSKRCALCRKEIPMDYFNHPRLVKISKELQGNESSEHEEKYSWYYEGRNGWWQYDERTNEELETAYIDEKESIEILIAGFLYVIDFENMVQMRRNDPTRQRMIKRDLTCAPKKGVAGLKMQTTVKVEHKRRTCDGEDNRSDALTPTVRKSESTDASSSQDPIYASSLQFTNIDNTDLELPEFELSSHTFHPVNTDSARSYVNSASGDYPGPDWEQASSGYTSMVSARSSLTESLSSDNSGYENLRTDISGAMQQNNAKPLTSAESSASNVNQPRKISRNAKKRSGRMFTKEEVDLPTPSVYDTVTMPTATYLNDRRAEPLPTPNISNLDGNMSELSINEPRRHSARHFARTRPTLPAPPPLPRRTNSLTSNSQKDEEGPQGLPGRAVRQNQKKEPKPNITHV